MRLRITLFLLPFILALSAFSQDENIVAMEYFIDVDPGVGNGTLIGITQGTPLDVNFSINTSALSIGFHELVVRARDSDGDDWGIQLSKVFYVSASDVNTNNLTELEYFFDTDPGFGNGATIAIGPSQTIDMQALITTTSLSLGFHEIFVRAKDSDDTWGMVQSRVFYVGNDGQGSATASNITGIEYFLDTDPGIGAGTSITIAAASSVDEDVVIPTSTLANGNYTLGVRVVDENGNYSLTETRNFDICTGAVADFSATTVCVGSGTDFTDLSTATLSGDVYSWDFDNDGTEDDSTVGNTSYTYPTAGTYTAVLMINRSGCVSTTEVTVTVEGVSIADAGVDQTISTDNTVLEATPAGAGETGTWSLIAGTGTFSDSNDPTATFSGITTSQTELRWTVTNDAVGCASSDDVTITMTTQTLSVETDIASFTLTEQHSAADINTISHSVLILVELGTDLTSLEPTITLSQGASISPSGPQDFTNTVIYTVTAEDGVTMQDWSVDVNERPLGIVGKDLKVFPNPVSDALSIHGIDGSYNLFLVDFTGKKMELGRSLKEVSLKNYPSGVYLLRIEIEGKDPIGVRIFKMN